MNEENIIKSIQKLESDIGVLENYLKTRPQYEYDRCVEVEFIKDMQYAINTLRNQLNNEWIPVSERFPEEYECRDGYIDPSKHVLVQDKSGNYHVSRYWKHRRSAPADNFPWIDINDYYDIVAWRVLPNRYEN